MEIFIDEAGQFTTQSRWSAICALTLPHKEVGQARRKIDFVSRDWPRAPNGELKGGSLDVSHLKILSSVLFERDALLHLSAIDMQDESENGLLEHKRLQCEGLTKHLTVEHHPSLVRQIGNLRSTLERIPMQLYVQTVLMRDLVATIIEDSTLYFSQRRPRELSNFSWTIDAKDPVKITTQEQWWLDTIGPSLESRGRRKPISMLSDPSADYRFFLKAYSLRKKLWHPTEPEQIADGYDIKKVVTDNIRFVDSRSDILIQAIDIFASFFRRTLNEELNDAEVAKALGRNQIRRMISGVPQSAHILSLSNDDRERSISVGTLLELMTKNGRAMLIPDRARTKLARLK
jgi:hypothetical protein